MQRREFLKYCGATAGGSYPALSLAAAINHGHPLAPKPGHFTPKAKRLVMIYLTGGFSHVDTFDPKPRLAADHGKQVSAASLRNTSVRPLLGSPFKFEACGKSGLMISDLFPRLRGVADELCVIRTLHTDILEHFQATLAMHTGSSTVPMPSIGAWLSYGLGTFNANLPSYVVLAETPPYAGAQVWDNNFLPPDHQGVRIVPGDEPVPNLRSQSRSVTLSELERIMLRDVNETHASARPDDFDLRARMSTFDIARGMMREAPEVLGLADESSATLDLYGVEPGDKKSIGWQCLIARRLSERGVRVVELIDSGSNENWDAHTNIMDHVAKAQRVDRGIAALIQDLRQRGLLSETLVAICTEFGRTPWAESVGGKGRGHWGKAFTSLLCGAGVQGGIAFGETDEIGEKIAANPVHVHDYHATILHLMGIDHERLTYRYAGRDFRLTDVHGTVVRPILT